MTDTKQISDAIKGLPDEGHFTKFAKAGVWVDVPTPLRNSDLKALVAENDSLKEALEQFVDGFSCSFNEAGMCIVHYKDNVDNEPNTCWNGKALNLITLTADGGNAEVDLLF